MVIDTLLYFVVTNSFFTSYLGTANQDYKLNLTMLYCIYSSWFQQTLFVQIKIPFRFLNYAVIHNNKKILIGTNVQISHMC